jgi:serine/threonine protein kinase
MWSLGCVYLEILVWFLEGYQALVSFRDSREAEVYPNGLIDEGFYYDDGSGVVQLREPVVTKIESLSRRCQGGLKEIVDTIPALLKIDPKERVQASQLVANLKHLGTGTSTTLTTGPTQSASLPIRALSSSNLPTHESDSDSDFGGIVKITRPSDG